MPDFTLTPDTIHLWTAHVDRLIPRRAQFRSLLSADECQRADRFIADDARLRFTVARGVMRTVLGMYLGIAPGEIVFSYGPRGKPSLKVEQIAETQIRFNLAHSANVVALAITQGHEIGVDVEEIRPMKEMVTIARDYFSAQEQGALFALPEGQREWAFFTGWTRKEAYIKAKGDGFALSLADFDVTLTPDQPARLLRAEGDDPARWSLLSVDTIPGYAGAVCVERRTTEANMHRVVLREFLF
jgi:4'-phosphopantetheinyl transferase